ncbi:hypothetical protein FACS1894137_01090 [Spirochaetia bacterium]|nr:hypothetical protein FACS1894137_01090 [Spirochaetia bacterium]
MVQLVHFSLPALMYDNVLMLDVAERFYRNGDDVKICNSIKSENMFHWGLDKRI